METTATVIERERRDRVRRWTRRAELTYQGNEQALAVGRWVVVADRYQAAPVELALIADGPHVVDGYRGPEEMWELHDQIMRYRDELTLLDLPEVIGEAIALMRDIRCGRYRLNGDQTAILRVHRSACLAAKVPRRDLDEQNIALLDTVVLVDREVAAAEAELATLIRERVPNLIRAIAGAAILELAREPGWVPNTSGIVHPWYGRAARHCARDRSGQTPLT